MLSESENLKQKLETALESSYRSLPIFFLCSFSLNDKKKKPNKYPLCLCEYMLTHKTSFNQHFFFFLERAMFQDCIQHYLIWSSLENQGNLFNLQKLS